ncbi:hypothetical protein GTW51_11700 [Aurantimonas aggregata]|uniref:Uncharacterized protein n=1 Tax=Aurantimonas aggregata TaxID=2047720 RepID=A0A6L9MHT9_9HYPH|nr:hypothetical protein [Aurantimonas aggregata]NDV87365.1 hypothetical protein [Aurantimonas aggregata]
MSEKLTGDTVAAMAALAGQELQPSSAERIALAIGPALAGFAPTEGTLPFAAEPSGFVVAQRAVPS